MYIVVLLVNDEYYFSKFENICLARDYAIKNYKVFKYLVDKNLYYIYNRLDYDGIGGFNFRLEL